MYYYLTYRPIKPMIIKPIFIITIKPINYVIYNKVQLL